MHAPRAAPTPCGIAPREQGADLSRLTARPGPILQLDATSTYQSAAGEIAASLVDAGADPRVEERTVGVTTGWIIGYVIGGVVVAIVAVLVLTLIRQTRQIVEQAHDIIAALDAAEVNTSALWAVSDVNRQLERALDAAKAARGVAGG
jgi:hypothetical protein